MIAETGLYFYKDATSVSDPEVYHSANSESIEVSVSGAFTGNFIFEGRTNLDDENWYPTSGVRMSDLQAANNFGTSGLYLVPISGLQRFRVRLTDLTEGSVSIYGRVMNS